mmetsp:Transcript_1604/g.2830  ORF Transcript_1604/g.2830 Transcript_1604/m.2830 type:complete len:366 (-) Transcript_1604:303-1400(-)
MVVDLLRSITVTVEKQLQDVALAGLINFLIARRSNLGVRSAKVNGRTHVISETRFRTIINTKGNLSELLTEEVLLVEEENHGSLTKEGRVADFVKENDGLIDAVHGVVFEEVLVVLVDCSDKDHSSDIVESVDPLLTLVTLATDIKHGNGDTVDNKFSLDDTRGTHTGAEEILVAGLVVISGDTVDFGHVPRERVLDLNVGALHPSGLDASILPDGLELLAHLSVNVVLVLIDLKNLIGKLLVLCWGMGVTGSHEDLNVGENIVIHDPDTLFQLGLGEAVLFCEKNLHLLKEGRLSGLTGTEEQELELVLLGLLLPTELAVERGVLRVALIDGASAGTHCLPIDVVFNYSTNCLSKYLCRTTVVL